MREKQSLHKRPSSCEVEVPRVNPAVWGILNHAATAADLRPQRSQTLLLTATHALAKVCNVCDEFKRENLRPVERCDICNRLNSKKTSHGFSRKRRGKILNALKVNKKYRKMASTKIPNYSVHGEDLKATFASTDSSSKLDTAFT